MELSEFYTFPTAYYYCYYFIYIFNIITGGNKHEIHVQ